MIEEHFTKGHKVFQGGIRKNAVLTSYICIMDTVVFEFLMSFYLNKLEN